MQHRLSKFMKRSSNSAIAGLLAAALLMCYGVGSASAANNLVYGNSPVDVSTFSTGDVTMYDHFPLPRSTVDLGGTLTPGVVLNNFTVNLSESSGAILQINNGLSFTGAGTFYGVHRNALGGSGTGGNGLSIQVGGDLSFGGQVILSGSSDHPEVGGSSLFVGNGSKVSAAGGFNINAGAKVYLSNGTLAGNVLVAGDPSRPREDPWLVIYDNTAKVDGNLTIGVDGGGKGQLVLADWQGNYHDFTVTGTLTLNNVSDHTGLEEQYRDFPAKTVLVGPGTTLTVGNMIVSGDSILAIGNATGAGKLVANNDAVFENTSKLILFAAKDAVQTGRNLYISADSRLVISGGEIGEHNDIFNIGADLMGTPDAWAGTNVTSSNPLLSIVSASWNGKQFLLSLAPGNPAASAPLLSSSMSGLISSMVNQVGVDPNSSNAGVRFISRAFDSGYLGNNPDQAAATIEGAAQLSQIAAVPGMTMAASNAGAGAVTGRTSFVAPQIGGTGAVAMHRDADGNVITGMSAGDSYSGMSTGNGYGRNGLGMWLMPLYQHNNVRGVKAGNFKTGYASSLGGIAFGADYTFQEMFRLGASFNVGGGYAKSNGDFNTSQSHSSFWGVNLYGGWAMDNFGVSIDGGYTGSYSDLRQELPSAMNMGQLKADVNSRAWYAGLRAEYCIETPVLDIIPHAGVRWTGIHVDSYKVKSGGDTVFNVDDSYQNIWTFPVGVSFAKSFKHESGWSFRPQVDAGVIPATGDVHSKTRVRIPGLADSADMKMQQVDYVTFDGTAGFEVANGKGFSVGVNYNLQLSEHRTGHGVYGTLRYEF